MVFDLVRLESVGCIPQLPEMGHLVSLYLLFCVCLFVCLFSIINRNAV